MNILMSCIGKRGYIADYFRPHLEGGLIVGTSNTVWTPGFTACDHGVLLPPIGESTWMPALLDTCTTYRIDAILSFFDPDVAALSAHHEALRARGVTPILPGPRTATIGFDKLETFHALREAGFAVPQTTASLDEALSWLASGRLTWPVVVKPRRGFGSAHTYIARDEQQLRAFWSVTGDLIAQQFLEAEAFDIEVLSDLDGRVLAVVPWRKHRSRLGETEQAVTVEAPQMVALGQRLAESIGLVGPMDVDLFVDADGTIWVLELNIRFGGGYPVTHLSGVDFPGLICAFLRGEEVEPRIGDYERGIAMLKGLSVIGGPVDDVCAHLMGKS